MVVLSSFETAVLLAACSHPHVNRHSIMADEKLPLTLHSGSGLVQIGSQGGRILAEMVSGALALSQSKEARAALNQRFRIGAHELCEPDYQQILLWAAALELEPATVIERLLKEHADCFSDEDCSVIVGGSEIVDGRISSLVWDTAQLPLCVFEWVEGLVIESIHLCDQGPNKRLHVFTPLPLPRLASLNCVQVQLRELDLTSVPLLKKLDCDYNELTDLDLSAVPLLTALNCDHNRLTELDLSAVPLLKELSCGANKLTELDLSAVPLLTRLDCQINQLTELDLSAVPLLTRLSCGSNQLTELDLSAVPLLTRLSRGGNQLIELDLSAVPQLTWLHCRKSQLTDLDLSAVPLLTALNCYDNRLTELDLSAVPLLTRLSCGSNQLTELDLSAVPLLTRLDCKSNQLTELDIRPLWNLYTLKYDKDKTRLIQRPDQTF
jgi:hypothetical protein